LDFVMSSYLSTEYPGSAAGEISFDNQKPFTKTARYSTSASAGYDEFVNQWQSSTRNSESYFPAAILTIFSL